jgi:hypothetical protein
MQINRRLPPQSGYNSYNYEISADCLTVMIILTRTKLWSDVNGNDFRDEYKNAGQATLAFSFLSIPVWIALAVFSFISLQAVAPA